MDEHILERVRRLLAIAHDTAASPNEQTVALERAQNSSTGTPSNNGNWNATTRPAASP